MHATWRHVQVFLLIPALHAATPAIPAPPAPRSEPTGSDWTYADIRRFAAPEARQGVAADEEFLYVISNHAIGKYRKTDGVRVASWECAPGEPLTHLNAGIVHRGRLYCAHSNYPGVPNLSSVEVWDTASLRHVGSRSFGRTDGSLTWLERYRDRWLACFVYYSGKGSEPGRDPTWTRLVEFDDEWRQTGGWAFPEDLMRKLSARGFSISGGAFGPDGLLYVTGHDDTALYGLKMPEAGPALTWVATLPIMAEGQAFDWDARDPTLLYAISKPAREVIIGRVTRKR
jgi:hypothetical protein